MLCRQPLLQIKRPSRERDRDPIGRSRGVKRRGAAGRGGGDDSNNKNNGRVWRQLNRERRIS